MPFCQNCGRPLNENEVCNCMSQNRTPQQQIPYPQQGQPYPYNYQRPYPAPQQPKQKNGCLIAGIICSVIALLFLLLILAAILIPAMIGYTRKSQKREADVTAKRYKDAVFSVLVELESCDCEGTDIDGTYIICSDKNANINVPFTIPSDFYDMIDTYAAIEEDTYEYFVVVEDGDCVYAAAHNMENDIIGTYPASSEVLTVRRYSGNEVDNDWSISDLYTDACTDLYGTYD